MLDVGCGGAHLGLSVMKKASFRGAFMDINPLAIDCGKKRAHQWDLFHRATFSIQDVQKMNYKSDSFDLIISRGSMGFWENQEKAFREIYRVLVPGGKTFIGSGLGTKEMQEEIRAKMKQFDPTWPENLKDRLKSLSTPEYIQMFDSMGLSYDVLEGEDYGRWFILKKPLKVSSS